MGGAEFGRLGPQSLGGGKCDRCRTLVSEDESRYWRTTAYVPVGTLSQLCEGSNGCELVAIAQIMANTQKATRQTSPLMGFSRNEVAGTKGRQLPWGQAAKMITRIPLDGGLG